MLDASHELNNFLETLARQAQPGERLPTIRELMRRFGASQMAVQKSFQALKSRGLIASEVGRGTYFLQGGSSADIRAAPPGTGPAPARSAARTVLLLRRSISIARGRALAEGLQLRLCQQGCKVLELAYTDPAHALAVLKGLPRFDACVVQSTYRAIPIELLAALKEKSSVLAVDGNSLAGADVEAVGTEWGEPLATAVDMLVERGHRRIAFATTSQPFLATGLGLRRLEYLARRDKGLDLQAILTPLLPDQSYAESVVELLRQRLDSSGKAPFTALIAWGIENGDHFRSMLADAGLNVPAALSVVLLGRTDLPNEHADFFEMVGSSVSDQVEALLRVIQSRWESPDAPHGAHLAPVTHRPGRSVAAPAKAAPQRPQR